MRVLVTGGAGFIGSNIVDELISLGHEVVIVDNLSTGKREYLNNNAKFFELDITTYELEKAFKDTRIDVVIHHAAQVSVEHSLNDPLKDQNINIKGTLNVLQFCAKYKVKKIIYASSAAIYGAPEYLPIDESHNVNPQSFYGISKKVPEMYINTYSQLYGIDFTILRYANVYGPRQDYMGEGGVISIFVNKILKNQVPVIFGDGSQTRDFIFVKDVVNANILSLTKGSGKTLNISTNSFLSLKELIAIMGQVVNQRIEPVFSDSRKGDINDSFLNNSLANDELGWRPLYTLKQGLEQTFRYYNKEQRILS